MIDIGRDKTNVFFFLNGADRFGELSNQIFLLKRLYPGNMNYQITVFTVPIDHFLKINRDLFNIVMRGVNLIYLPKKLISEIIEISPELNFPFILIDSNFEFPLIKFFFKFMYYNKKLHMSNHPFSLTYLEKETGKQLRKKFGIPADAPIVTFHVREQGFLNLYTYHNYRNASIENFIPTINYLIQKGYYVVRVGDRSMTKIKNLPKQFIDIHFHKDYKSLADIYFISQSSFLLATISGPYIVAKTFGIPVLVTNSYLTEYHGCFDTSIDLHIFKKYYSEQLNRYLTYEEILFSPIIGFSKEKNYSDANIQLIENSPEEILTATKEIIDRLKGKYPIEICNKINKRVQDLHSKAFSYHNKLPYSLSYSDKAITTPFRYTTFYSNFQISAEYIRLNPHFLGHLWPECSFQQMHSNDDLISTTKYLYEIGDAEKLYKNGKISESEKAFFHVLEMDPTNKLAYNNLGVIAFHKKQYQKAFDFCQKSIDYDPFYKKAILNLHNIVMVTKQYQLIMPILKTYLAKNPLDEEILKIFENILECTEKISSINRIELKHCNANTKEVISKWIRHYNFFNPTGYRVNKPHRNLIITEIPGSGIEYFTHILNYVDNAVNFEGFLDNIYALPNVFFELRKRILTLPKENLYGPVNISISPSQKYTAVLPDLSKNVDEDVIIGLNLNIIYHSFNNLKRIKIDELNLLNSFGYRVIALIRDPVETIIHWNQPEYHFLPEANVTENEGSALWKSIIPFDSLDKYDRQAQIWQYYANLFLALRSMKGTDNHWKELIEVIKIYTYEQLVQKVNCILSDCSEFLSIPIIKRNPPLLKLVKYENFKDIERIKNSVRKYCSARFELGYDDVSKHKIPGFCNKKQDISKRSVDYKYLK